MAELYIDEVDAISAYGLHLSEEAYNGVVCFPAMKDIEYNDWPDEDGIEPDLHSPVLDAKELDIRFFSTDVAKTVEFLNAITDGAYHSFEFEDFGITMSLRLVSMPERDKFEDMQLFSLRFSFDGNPLEGYTYAAPSSSLKLSTDEIDGIDFATYGLTILEGTESEVTSTPDIKENLKCGSQFSTGVTYDGENVYYKSKDVKLTLLMRSDSVSEFWQNWRALLYNLTQPSDRELLFNSESYNFYYKSCQTKEFAMFGDGMVWWKFDLNVCFYDYRAGVFDLLANEDGSLVMFEDGYFVEM